MRTDYNRFQKFKLLMHSDRVRAILADEMPSPVEWVIYPSNICGYQCAHCIMAKEQQEHRKMLSADAMRRIPDDAVLHEIHSVVFSGGGDPLLNPHTMEAAIRLKHAGITVCINNQGYLLNDPTPFSSVRYSVDAATPETYQKIHSVPKGDGWERVNKNVAHHAAMNRNGHKIEMGLAFLITPWNWQEVEKFVEWAVQFNPTFVHIRPAYLDAGYLDEKYPEGGKFLKEVAIPALKEAAQEIEKNHPNVYFRVDKFEGFWTPKLYSKCRSTPLMAVTSGDGAFLVCQDRGISKAEDYLRWGDYNTQTFDQIWWSEEHKRVIQSIDLDKCPRCVENGYNEIIQHCFVEDGLRSAIL